MIRHIVMWTLANPADAPYFKAQLDSCANIVPGIVSLEVGIASAGLENNCHVVLNSVFTDATALDAYQAHPHHQVVSANVGKLRITRHVLDYAV
jgi:quinol monooxygenase YgiN